MTLVRRAVWPLAMLLGLAACIDMTPNSERDQLVVFAPVELQNLVEQALRGFYAQRGTVVPRARFGRSAELMQVATNDSIHVVVTSHPAWADYVVSRAGHPVERGVAGRGRMVLAAASAPAVLAAGGDPVARIGDGSLGRLILPSTESDSVGIYAREALLRYGIWSRAQDHVRLAADSQEAVAAVLTGAADVAILLQSTASAAGLATLASIDPAFHQPIEFEALLLNDAHPDARALWESLVATGPALALDSR